MSDDCKQMLNIDCTEYFDGKFAELEKRLELRDELTSKALEKADVVLEHRLESLNNISGRISGLMPRSEYDLNHKILQTQLDNISRNVYIGMGILVAVEVLLRFIKF